MISLIAGKQRARGGVLLRGVVAILLGGLLVLAGAQSASAHAELLSTTPEDGAVLAQAPAEAMLTFNEPVRLIAGSVRLFPGGGEPLTLNARVVDAAVAAAFPDDLADGRYALSYRVVSADGHPISGAIMFTIGDAAGPDDAPVVETATPGSTRGAVGILTGVQYLALLVFAGLLFFDRGVRRNQGQIDPVSRRLLRGTGTAAVTASLLLIPVSALNVTGAPLTALFAPARWWSGVFWGPWVAAIVVMVGVAGASVANVRRSGNSPRGAVAVGFAALAVAASVLVGHSQLIEPRPLMILADLGHLFAGSFWVGGVLGLLVVIAEAKPQRGAEGMPDATVVAQIVQRFSRFAVGSVILLAISGTVMGVMIVGSVDALVTTGYGLTLLLKVGIALPVIAIAAYNRRRLLPSLSTRATASAQWSLLHRTLAYEAALLIVILAVTGFLTNLSPSHDHHAAAASTPEASEPVAFAAEAQGLAVDGSLEPGIAGDNAIAFMLRYDNEPLADAEVTLRVSQPEHDLGPFQVSPDLDPDTGEFRAELALPVAGIWQVQIIARVSTFAEPIVTVPVTIG